VQSQSQGGVLTPDLPDQGVISFPDGLPGLDESARFHLLRLDDVAPILLLQDCDNDQISLPVVPVELIDPSYQLPMSDADWVALGLPAGDESRSELLCLTVLILPGADHPPTCNLLAPIVINTRTLVAKQVLQVESDYPSVFPLTAG